MNIRRCAFAAAMTLPLLLAVPPAGGDPPTSSWDDFVERAEQAHGGAGRRAAEFLRRHRPDSDADLGADLLMSNLDLAFRAREEFPWARDVPEDLFLNDVLPYAVFDETREDWRPGFLDKCREIVRGCASATEAIQALNRDIFDVVNVHYNTGRKRPNQSPSESIEQGRATCTGLAIILVDACRCVGIPARGAGVASWHDKRGNHTWVEAWDGRWRFTGADEYDAGGLDRAWFTGDAAKAVPGDPTFAVWATSWKRTGHHFPMVWNPRSREVAGVDVTEHYLLDEPDAPAAGAVRHLRAWSGDDRIAATVRVVGPHGDVVARAITNAGTSDLNDMPSVTLTPGSPCTLELDWEGRTYVAPLQSDAAGDKTIDLRISEMTPALTEEEAAAAIDEAWRDERASILAERAGKPEDVFEWNGQTMRILERTFGYEPADGRSLWISMHGGGGAPERVNDQQWRNQIRLYEPEEGIVVAPRAPTNTWNLWHQAHIDPLFDRLIATYIATRNINPDKVYLLGYSAGGDGVYQLAPRMADRFAAAAMMAGHPNESEPLGLRNLPFAIFVGGRDDAYNRNTVAAEWGAKLDALREADPDGYPHRVTIYPDCGHWMNGEDREAIPWMAANTRDPWPHKVVWRQDDVTHTRFYWLEIAPEDAAAGRTVTAEVDGQEIRIRSDDVPALTIHLRDGLLDLDRPVIARVNGEIEFEGMVRRTTDAVSRSFAHRRDPRTASTARLNIRWQRP